MRVTGVPNSDRRSATEARRPGENEVRTSKFEVRGKRTTMVYGHGHESSDRRNWIGPLRQTSSDNLLGACCPGQFSVKTPTMPLASTVLHHADLVRSSHFDIRTSFSPPLCASVAVSFPFSSPSLTQSSHSQHSPRPDSQNGDRRSRATDTSV